MPRLKAPQRREQLIEVATKLFAKYGFEATTTAAIAEASGVTEPILYRHFQGKQELFIEITRAMSQKTMKHWRELISSGKSSIEKIRTIAREFPNHIRRLEDAYHVIHGALATSQDRRVIAVLKEHYGEIEGFFRQIVADGQQSGEFRDDLDPIVPTWQLINAGIGYTMITLKLQSMEHFPLEETIEFILRGMKA